MAKRTVKLYTLPALAKLLNTSYQYLRVITGRMDKSAPNSYKGYRFVIGGKRGWMAYAEDQGIEIEIIGDQED